jgi:hypothetical protein
MWQIASAVLGLGLLAATAAAAAPADPSFDIQLERGACFGSCPTYTVDIQAGGQVVFTGSGGGRLHTVTCFGERRWRIARSAVTRLQATVDRIGFMGLQASYNSRVRDLPMRVVTVTRSGQTKSVQDLDGMMVGMPQAVVDLETAIDAAAGVSRCLKHPAA